MAKDFSRRPLRKKNKAPKQFVLVFVSFLSGYLTATVFDFNSLIGWANKNVLAKHSSQKIAAALETKAKEPELPKPKFEFYTLLTKDRAVVTPPPIAVKPLTQQQNEAPAVVVNSKESYYIQIAAFKNRQDAEHLKAELTLKGYDVNITATLQQQVNWYRVNIGPFKSRTDAEKTQIALADHERIKGMLRKMA